MIKPHSSNWINSVLRLLITVSIVMVAAHHSFAQGLVNIIPPDQAPVLKTFPPLPAQQSKTGTGKFVILTREQLGQQWDFIAGAWECIPSMPAQPITKRIEFCHSSWHATPLLDVLVGREDHGLFPRFVSLQVDQKLGGYTENLYDINYRTWAVKCLWQGRRLSAFAVTGNSIFCKSTQRTFVIDGDTGKIRRNNAFTPERVMGEFWIVTKPGDNKKWCYHPKTQKFVGSFLPIRPGRYSYASSVLSPDGKTRAWLIATLPVNWRGGKLRGKLIIQRVGVKVDTSHPVEFIASSGSGIPVIPNHVNLAFSDRSNLQFRAWLGAPTDKDRVWEVNLETGKVTASLRPHVPPKYGGFTEIEGVPVPKYLEASIVNYTHFGRGGLAPAFLMHQGVLKEKPSYPECNVAVSPDGRHILYKARKGPLAGEFIYGDLITKQVVRWKSPAKLRSCHSMEFIWVETPPPPVKADRTSLETTPK